MTVTAIYEATLQHVATATTMATATEVGFPPLLYLTSNRFLRFPLDYPNLDMDVVFGFALFIEICFSCWDFKIVTGVLAMSGHFLFWRIYFQFLVQFFTLPPTDIKRG